MAARVTYRRKHTYRTRSNQIRKLRTPGKLIYINIKEENYPFNILIKEMVSEYVGIPESHLMELAEPVILYTED
jgi:hypothetical protein